MGEVHTELFLLAVGVMLLVSLLVNRLGGRLGIPGLLLFLGVGMLAGSDGLGIQFQDYRLAQALGTLALCFILFQGGLDTNWAKTRPVVRRGLSLATVGVLVTAGVMAAFAHYAFGFPWLAAWLLGAIVSSTGKPDPARKARVCPAARASPAARKPCTAPRRSASRPRIGPAARRTSIAAASKVPISLASSPRASRKGGRNGESAPYPP